LRPAPVVSKPAEQPKLVQQVSWKEQLKPTDFTPSEEPLTPEKPPEFVEVQLKPTPVAPAEEPKVVAPVQFEAAKVLLKPVFTEVSTVPAVTVEEPVVVEEKPKPVAPPPVPKPACVAFKLDARKGLNTCVCGKLKAQHAPCAVYTQASFNICKCGFSLSEHHHKKPGPAQLAPALDPSPPRPAPVSPPAPRAAPPPPAAPTLVPTRAAPPPPKVEVVQRSAPPPPVVTTPPPVVVSPPPVVAVPEVVEVAVEVATWWTCTGCEMENEASNDKCLMCEKERH
jgi:hypothetical protein